MEFLLRRSGHQSFFPGRRKLPNSVFLFSVFFALVVGVGVGAWRYRRYYRGLPSARSVYEDWKNGNYKAVYDKAAEILQRRVFDAEMLALHGFAAYYIFSEQTDLSVSYDYLNSAIVSLRRALHVVRPAEVPNVSYVLGKAYYQRGYYYADLAVKYLDLAYNAGFRAADLAEFRGMSASLLGDMQKAVESFTQALAAQPSDLVLYALAECYEKLSDFSKAKLYLYDTIGKTKDVLLELKCRNRLAALYLSERNLAEAERELDVVLQKDERSAEAHYHRGVLYEMGSDLVRARAEWRHALRLNPLHEPTRVKLNLK